MATSVWAHLVLGNSTTRVYADRSQHYGYIDLGMGISPEAFVKALRFVTDMGDNITVEEGGDVQYPSAVTPTVLTMLRRIYPEVTHISKDSETTYKESPVIPDVDDSKAQEFSQFVWDLERYGYTDEHSAKVYRDQYRTALRRERELWAAVSKEEDRFYVKAMMGLAGSEVADNEAE